MLTMCQQFFPICSITTLLFLLTVEMPHPNSSECNFTATVASVNWFMYSHFQHWLLKSLLPPLALIYKYEYQLQDKSELNKAGTSKSEWQIDLCQVYLLDWDFLISISYEHAAHLWKQGALHSLRNYGNLLSSTSQYITLIIILKS